MYTCIYVYMSTRVYVYIYIYIYNVYTNIYVYMYICICVHKYKCTYVHLHICIYIWMYRRNYVYGKNCIIYVYHIIVNDTIWCHILWYKFNVQYKAHDQVEQRSNIIKQTLPRTVPPFRYRTYKTPTWLDPRVCTKTCAKAQTVKTTASTISLLDCFSTRAHLVNTGGKEGCQNATMCLCRRRLIVPNAL